MLAPGAGFHNGETGRDDRDVENREGESENTEWGKFQASWGLQKRELGGNP